MTMAECKAALVAAHRSGDGEAMRKFSQMRQRLKKRRYCELCGARVNGTARHCKAHEMIHRKGKVLPEPIDDGD